MGIRIRQMLRTQRSPGSEPSAGLKYGVAGLASLTALGIRIALNPVLGEYSPYLPFILAVIIAARFGGRGPGFAFTALSTVGVLFFLFEEHHLILLANHAAAAGLALFVIVGCLISLLVGHLRESLIATARAEQTLRRKRQLIDLSQDAVIAAEPNRCITSWNLGATEMYGWTEADALGKVIHDLLQTKTSSGISVAGIDESLLRDGRWSGELVHIARDGRRIVVESRQVLVRDDRNEPVGMLEINRDVTERKQAEQALRESEERLSLAQKVARVGTFEWNIQTGVNRWTPEMEAMYDLPPGGFAGTEQAWEELVHPDDRPEAVRRVNEAMETGSLEAEWRITCSDGTSRWLAGRAWMFRDEFGEPLRLVGVNIDITEHKRAEEAVRQASEQRRLALEAARMGAWEYLLDTGRIFWDERCARIFGESTGGLVDYDTALARIHPDDRALDREARKQAISGTSSGAYDRECRVIWPDGSLHWVASHGRAFFEGEGDHRHAVRFVGVSMEITDRRHAEERLRQTQKLESIGLLAGGVAHDFNNLLTVIMGSASAALARSPSDEYSKSILAASESAAALTKQLLAYAGKGMVKVELVELTELVAQTTGLLSASVTKRTHLSYRLSKDLPCLEADPVQIEQILMNLVINAGEAIPPHSDGLIEIATSSCDVTPELARRQHSKGFDVAPGVHVCLEVRDNGAGMDEATISRIFEPFFSTKFTGRGLGLAALQGIVRTSKGFIEVRSSPGHGTTFRVYLPASKKSRLAERAPSPVRQQQRGSSTVLVVDDEEMVRKLACMTLKQYGYEVLDAKDGRGALQLLAEAPSLPSVVLLDLAMPVMGGEELVPVLQQKYPDLKIIISSGYPEEDARQGFSPGSVAGFLQKPYTGVTLVEKIRESLSGVDRMGPGVATQNGRIIEFPRTG